MLSIAHRSAVRAFRPIAAAFVSNPVLPAGLKPVDRHALPKPQQSHHFNTHDRPAGSDSSTLSAADFLWSSSSSSYLRAPSRTTAPSIHPRSGTVCRAVLCLRPVVFPSTLSDHGIYHCSCTTIHTPAPHTTTAGDVHSHRSSPTINHWPPQAHPMIW